MATTRLGLDIGTNSIGWALLKLKDGKPAGVIRTGVRIFSDGRNPKDGSSLAVTRREARQQRRMRDRKIKRQTRLIGALAEAGLMPAGVKERKLLEHVEPLKVRAAALDELVNPHHLGRALFHLAKRRGFKSNRKTDGPASEAGVIASSISSTKAQMASEGARTYGEWLNNRQCRGEGVRARTSGTGANKAYDVYSDRSLTEQEIDLLFTTQRALGSKPCTEEAQNRIKDVILFQRDLLPVSPGKCTFEQNESRGALADLRVQAFRIYQELNNIRVLNERYEQRTLSLEERDALARELQQRPKLTMAQIRKKLALGEKEQINFEGSRDFLVGNQTNNAIANKKILGKKWYTLDEATQAKIVELLLRIESDEELLEHLRNFICLSAEDCERLLSASLVDGYGKLSIKAISAIIPHLQSEVITFDKAAAIAGYHHSNQYTGEWHKELPYYGAILQQYTGSPIASSGNEDESRFGRIANPTVHVALNQLRKIVNAIIKKYGHPDEIHIEVIRDLKLSQKAKRDLKTQQKNNQVRNDGHRARLTELGQKDTYDNRLRLTLWEELAEQPMDRCCPFSGTRIGIESLFTSEVQIEHLIPFADCLDDSQSNKTLSTRKANNDKGKRTPFEAFGNNQGNYCWEDILDRADRLPKNKRRRFAPEARSLFSGDDWLARQLNDTAYISRVSRQYLTAICNPNCVRVTPGRLTALFRRSLGLEDLVGESAGKDRNDHRHHAVDAVVVALTEASLIRTASRYASNDSIDRLSERLAAMEPPWTGFSDEVRASMEKLQVSHKPDHATEAGLHNDTAYGLAGSPDKDGVSVVRYRKPIVSLKEKDLEKINDSQLASAIRNHIAHSNETFEKALLEFCGQSRAQKCTLEERMNVIAIKDKIGTPYKGYKGDGNYCYEIDWLPTGEWGGRVISSFEANQRQYQEYLKGPASKFISFDGRPLAMRLCRDDILALEVDGTRKLMRVATLSLGKLTLAQIQEANSDARNRSPDDPFQYMSKSPNALRKLKGRRVFIDSIGTVKDPGPPVCPPESSR